MIMKKQLLLLVVMLLPLVASAHDIEVKNADGKTIYYNWIKDHTELEVTYGGSSKPYYSGDGVYTGSLSVPETVTYNGNKYPVTRIGDYAFYQSKNLTSVSLPQDLIDIGRSAFFGTARYMNATDGVFYVNKVACGYKGSVPSNTTLVIKAETRAIADWAFASSGITSLILPNSIIHIGKAAFRSSALASINVQSGNSVYDSRNNCNAVIETESNKLVLGCKNTVIPEEITEIGDYAFYESSITSITIHDGIKAIGNYAFYDCGFSSVYIPKNIIFIGKSAFDYNDLMESISVDPENAVYDSRNNCNAIIETASNTLLFGCNNTAIPNSVTTIGRRAFIGKNNIQSISIPNSVKNIDYMAFWGCSSLEQLSLPNSVEVIGDSAFYSCLKLNTVTFSNKLKSIGKYAFGECGLVSVTIPEGITNLSYCMFFNCKKISSVVLPSSLVEYGGSVFYNCSAIKNVYNYSTVPVNANYIFPSSISSATLHVPEASIIDYYLAEPWGSFGSIVALKDEDPNPTKINNLILENNTNSVYYDLNGRKLNEPRKGINVIGGKKVVVK